MRNGDDLCVLVAKKILQLLLGQLHNYKLTLQCTDNLSHPVQSILTK